MALPHTCNAITAPRLYRYRTAVTLFPACGNTRLSEVCSWKNSHRIHSKFLVEKTSTDFTLSLQLKKLPQISQILTDVRARILPTESTLSLQLKKLPQISQILTDVNPAKRNVLDLKNETCKNREKRNVLKISHTRHFKTTKKQSKTGCFYSFWTANKRRSNEVQIMRH